jgi:hypothetical protein
MMAAEPFVECTGSRRTGCDALPKHVPVQWAMVSSAHSI